MASQAAALTGPATSKSGRPIERLIGSFIDLAMSNALRMPEASIDLIRSAIQASFTSRAPGSGRWQGKPPILGGGLAPGVEGGAQAASRVAEGGRVRVS